MDEGALQIVKDMVSEFAYEFQLKMADLRDRLASLEGRLAPLEAAGGAAAVSREQASDLQGRLASLEAAAAATAEGLAELRASRAKAPAESPERPVTLYDFMELDAKTSALASEMALAKSSREQDMRDIQAQLKVKRGRSIQRDVERLDGEAKRVAALQEQVERYRIGSAVFALGAIGLKESDRKGCMDRLRGEEERLRRSWLGETPDIQTGPADASVLPPEALISESSARSAPLPKNGGGFKLWKRAVA